MVMVLCTTAILCGIPAHSDMPDSLLSASDNQSWRLPVVIGGAAAIVVAAHLQNYDSWWKGERSAFHYATVDDAYPLGADKLGHCYFTYLATDIIGNSFVWAGVERRRAFVYSGSLALAFQLYVEVEDGFTKSLGFSPGDAVSDIIGAAYPSVQDRVPWLQGVRLKWSAIPSEKYKRHLYRTIIDDYESQYYWLSVAQSSFPRFLQCVVPSFLGVVVGYGVKNLNRTGDGERELYLGLDYDFTQLLGKGSFLSAVKHVLNFIRFPAPTIRLAPSVVAYGLRW
jgi:hypothetical protein